MMMNQSWEKRAKGNHIIIKKYHHRMSPPSSKEHLMEQGSEPIAKRQHQRRRISVQFRVFGILARMHLCFPARPYPWRSRA